MTIAVVAEKPSVARDLARVLGASTRGEGCLRGNGYVVTWAIGHLVALAEPHQIDARWRAWRMADLPMLPSQWPLVVLEGTKAQFEVVRGILAERDVDEIVCATDAGREGELIFRYIYEAARSKKPVKRLWLSSLTPDAIALAFRALKPAASFDSLAAAARARSRADWLVGMNFSRAYSVTHDAMFSVGRVQTPTLAMVVARELEICAFVPEDYFEIAATFDARAPEARGSDATEGEYRGLYFISPKDGTKDGPKDGKRRDAARLPKDGEEAKRIVARVLLGKAAVESIDRETHVLPPPRLYDLTELQRHANRLYGMSAQRTLDIAQSLYEKKKLLSYPRTDSRHLSSTVAATLPDIVNAIESPYSALVAPGTGARPLGRRFVDDAQVTEHHAIIPTTTVADRRTLAPDEERIYDLVCRRLLSAWHDDHHYATTTLVTAVSTREADADLVDRFVTSGTSIERVGWKVLDVKTGKQQDDARPTVPAGLAKGRDVAVIDAKALPRKTRPPDRYTDATLLTAMESAGRTLEEKELSEAMRDSGLGTPATRAATLETLLRREYMRREGRALHATDQGIALILAVHPRVKSPVLTGEWEHALRRLERGQGSFETFLAGIEAFVRDVVGEVSRTAPSPRANGAAPLARAPSPSKNGEYARNDESNESPINSAESRARAPARESAMTHSIARAESLPPRTRAPWKGALSTLLETTFGFDAFRPFQEEACKAVAAGRDVLLVMPTGAGKSLCYQLPGLARGGTTLVISPLIALMEDQVAKLQALGLAAERIHSGRDRAASRQACRSYLDGTLDFLFIAPERLKVPGFAEMLARRTPSLIAVDEAHCISQWGHDFRPDYRMLGERLPLLRPAPVMALTATATPAVQADIVTQLSLVSPALFIHGFRRTNLAIEVIERSPGERTSAVRELLNDASRRPAILYAPTRKHAEALAAELGAFRSAAYHAGLPAKARDDIQSAFLGGALDVIVATIAFGMGIDKADVRTVVHTALPATVEGYYQEIGRAGRDGKPSRAVLFQSFVDRKTHDFFLERDYPESEILTRLFDALSVRPRDKDALKKHVPHDVLDKALEKLWLHGGALVAPDETVMRGNASWKRSYEAQRKHRVAQLESMQRFAKSDVCRMLQLIRHFGDERDGGNPCGICDVCAPTSAIAHRFREPTAAEGDAARRILDALSVRDGLTVGQLHRDTFANDALDRDSLEHVLGGLARAGAVTLEDASFEKDGETIAFQRVRLGRVPIGAFVVRRGATPKAERGARKARGGERGERGASNTPSRAKRPRAKKDDREAPTGPLVDALRAWRVAEARRKGLPAFRILSDRVLFAVAGALPRSEEALLRLPGLGPSLVAKYGKQLLAIVGQTR